MLASLEDYQNQKRAVPTKPVARVPTVAATMVDVWTISQLVPYLSNSSWCEGGGNVRKAAGKLENP
jgi:hypothetical protein